MSVTGSGSDILGFGPNPDMTYQECYDSSAGKFLPFHLECLLDERPENLDVQHLKFLIWSLGQQMEQVCVSKLQTADVNSMLVAFENRIAKASHLLGDRLAPNTTSTRRQDEAAELNAAELMATDEAEKGKERRAEKRRKQKLHKRREGQRASRKQLAPQEDIEDQRVKIYIQYKGTFIHVAAVDEEYSKRRSQSAPPSLRNDILPRDDPETISIPSTLSSLFYMTLH